MRIKIVIGLHVSMEFLEEAKNDKEITTNQVIEKDNKNSL